jgi:hypothetical protein
MRSRIFFAFIILHREKLIANYNGNINFYRDFGATCTRQVPAYYRCNTDEKAFISKPCFLELKLMGKKKMSKPTTDQNEHEGKSFLEKLKAQVTNRRLISAKGVSIIAISAALYATFFFLSSAAGVPQFVVLYLPIILLGVCPIWFGLNGLVGSMIGAFIGGVFVEGLGFYSWIESVTTLIIYALNWLLITQKATEVKKNRNLFVLLGVYAGTLFVGTSYVLWQLTILGVLPASVAEALLLPTVGLNLVIESSICPVLIRTLSPKLRNMGTYAGTFQEWRSRQTKT